jgi:3-oxoadipate enol-lactonase
LPPTRNGARMTGTVAAGSGDVGMATMGDGCRIAYCLEGPASGPCLVLSHSLGTTMDMWAPQMAALSRDFRVLRYDSRGHGASSAPAGAYSMDRLGRDVIELLDGLGIASMSFCGLSLGGMVGQWLGWRAPERIERLVIANSSAYMGPPQDWDARIGTVLADGLSAMVGPVMQRWFTPAFRESHAQAIAPIRAMLLATKAQGYAGCCSAIRDMDQRRLGALIRAPTLVIGGESDPATPPDHATRLAAAIPGAWLAMIAAAHLSNVEQSAPFTDLITGFLTEPKVPGVSQPSVLSKL